MSTTLESILLASSTGVSPFAQNSRYYGIYTATLETDDGETIVYIKRRFIPLPETMQTIRRHVVRNGDRLDKIAAVVYGDSELYWQICDANRAMQPQRLTEHPGDRIVLALPSNAGGSGG